MRFKSFILSILLTFSFFLSSDAAFAVNKGVGEDCTSFDTCPTGYACKLEPDNPRKASCQPTDEATDTFGKVTPPDSLKGLIGLDSTGTGGISSFLTNLIRLIYILAGVVLIFMLIWGAFDWLTSAGDKEKLQGAQRKIVNAVIGIVLFAAAFAIVQVLSSFTGFQFFKI